MQMDGAEAVEMSDGWEGVHAIRPNVATSADYLHMNSVPDLFCLLHAGSTSNLIITQHEAYMCIYPETFSAGCCASEILGVLLSRCKTAVVQLQTLAPSTKYKLPTVASITSNSSLHRSHCLSRCTLASWGEHSFGCLKEVLSVLSSLVPSEIQCLILRET